MTDNARKAVEMAGDWIKMRVDLATDPAVIQMGMELNLGEDLIVGKLHRFWAWVTTHFAEAILKPKIGFNSASLKPEMSQLEAMTCWIDRFVGVPGFVQAMLNCQWLCIENECLCVPNYDRHMSEGAKSRAVRSEQQRARRRSQIEANLKPKSGFKTASREEKRREDIDIPPRGISEARSKFVPPTVDEVREYCQSRGNSVDPQAFVDHYVSNGWRVGKNPMRNWQAAVRKWENNQFSNGKSATSRNGAGQRYDPKASEKDPDHGNF